MILNIKHYSQKARLLYLIMNILLILISIGLFVTYNFIKSNREISSAKSIGILFISSVAILFLINLVKIYLEYSKKKYITKNIEKFVNEKKYLTAKEYLKEECHKMNFYSNYQMILYYLGYIESALDNLDYAKKYFIKIKIEKINYANVRMIVSTIFLLGLMYYYEEDSSSINEMVKIIDDKRKKVLSYTKEKVKYDRLLNIIVDLNTSNELEGIDFIRNSVYQNIPFIHRLIHRKSIY